MKTYREYLTEIKMPPERLSLKKDINKSQDKGFYKIRYSDLPQLMKKYGWFEIGHGENAHVYQHPKKNYIVKIFADDPLTNIWLKYVAKNQSNPYLPKLRGRPVKISKGLYSVRMEILKPIDDIDRYYDLIDEENDNLRKVLDYLQQFDLYGVSDLHEENVMLRKNQLVIVDPVTSSVLLNKTEKYIKAVLSDLSSEKEADKLMKDF